MAFPCFCCDDDSDEEEVPSWAKWYLPPWPRQDGQREFATIHAAKDLQVGELVELSYCLEVPMEDVPDCYIADYCPLAPWRDRHGKVVRLLPLCWGFVLLSAGLAGEANLEAVPVKEPAPTPPVDADGRVDALSSAMTAFIKFRPVRPIKAGEALRARLRSSSSQMAFPPRCIFETARAITGLDRCSCQGSADEAAPEAVPLPEDPAVRLAASSVHGVGMFACRDIYPGDLLEFTPVLPFLATDSLPGTALLDYPFGSTFQGGSAGKLSSYVLGGGAIYNHAEEPDVLYKPYNNNPFVLEWRAERFVPQGAEVFSNYGEDWFEARGMAEK